MTRLYGSPDPPFWTFGGIGPDEVTASRKSLRAAREAMALTWRNRSVPMDNYAARYGMTRDYPFWRRVVLARIARCKAALRKAKQERDWLKERGLL